MYLAPLTLDRRKSCGRSLRTEHDPETLGTREAPQVWREFAATHGYEVTAVEVAEVGGLPLSDDQLSQVAGGAETVHLYLKSH